MGNRYSSDVLAAVGIRRDHIPYRSGVPWSTYGRENRQMPSKSLLTGFSDCVRVNGKLNRSYHCTRLGIVGKLVKVYDLDKPQGSNRRNTIDF